jgi:hypothetical protein
MAQIEGGSALRSGDDRERAANVSKAKQLMEEERQRRIQEQVKANRNENFRRQMAATNVNKAMDMEKARRMAEEAHKAMVSEQERLEAVKQVDAAMEEERERLMRASVSGARQAGAAELSALMAQIDAGSFQLKGVRI